ncbi:MAG: hypothetical protein WD646_15785 [Actinomycetota bacterium]
MGSRADDKLKEIEELRDGLGRKLEAIEQRFPMAGLGKKVAGLVAGGSVGGSALAFLFRRARRNRKRAKPAAAMPTAPVTVNVIPKGAAWVAAAGVAAWAGARLYESIKRSRGDAAGDGFRPAVVKPMPESGRQSGLGN